MKNKFDKFSTFCEVYGDLNEFSSDLLKESEAKRITPELIIKIRDLITSLLDAEKHDKRFSLVRKQLIEAYGNLIDINKSL